ncbi:hypothetical protein ABZ953_03705 [Streptomyces sp. NPDC046465]|uniref:hypothetical protein n=1 Tax=Streptomyces sp. NPDC046465 TaxID=3155810 RepID=UPI0033D78CAA
MDNLKELGDGMTSPMRVARRLPWSTLEGKPCYLIGSGNGFLSNVADTIESIQLGMAGDLLGHAGDLLADPKATPAEVRFVAARLTESLREVQRIAESRGDRLSQLDCDDADEGDDHGPRLPAGAIG